MDLIDINNISDQNLIDYKKIHDESFIDVNSDLSYPPAALSIGEQLVAQTIYPRIFGSYGNFSCIVGASKSKKTFIKSLVLASFIGGESTNYAPEFKSHRVNDMFVIDIDTEQGDWHAQRVFKRVLEICGGNYPMYKPFYLRKYDYKERLEFIEWLFLESEYKNNIGFASIDGFADLVNDVNDLKQANELVQKLLMWTDVSKCHLTGILHKNFDSKKPTGHLGSAILKKAETVCLLDRNENNPEYTNVSFPYTRSFNIDDFSFSVNSNGLPVVEENKLTF